MYIKQLEIKRTARMQTESADSYAKVTKHCLCLRVDNFSATADEVLFDSFDFMPARWYCVVLCHSRQGVQLYVDGRFV